MSASLNHIRFEYISHTLLSGLNYQGANICHNMRCESARTKSEWLAARAKAALTQWKTFFHGNYQHAIQQLQWGDLQLSHQTSSQLLASQSRQSLGPASLGCSLPILSWLARKLPLAKPTYLGFPVCSLVDICFQLTSAWIANTLFLSQVSGRCDLCPWSSPTVTDIILPDSPDLECSALLRSYSLENILSDFCWIQSVVFSWLSQETHQTHVVFVSSHVHSTSLDPVMATLIQTHAWNPFNQ